MAVKKLFYLKSALLNQHVTLGVEYEHRKGSVELPGARVHQELVSFAEHLVRCIDEDYLTHLNSPKKFAGWLATDPV